MYSCLRLTKIAIALAIGIQLLQPSQAVGKERVKSGSEPHSSVALSKETASKPYSGAEINNKNGNCENGICSDVGSPGRRRGAGSRWIEE